MVQRQKEGFHVRDLRNAGPEHQPPPALQLGIFHSSPFLFIVVSFLFPPCAWPSRQGKRFVGAHAFRGLPEISTTVPLITTVSSTLFGAWNVWLWSRVGVNESNKPGTWSLPPVDLTQPANVPGLQRVLLATAAFPQLLGKYLDVPL